MERIVLDEEFSMHHDGVSWTLYQEREGGLHPITKKRGIAKTQTYHADIKQTLNKYVDLSVSGSKTVLEMFDKLNEVLETIKKLKL